MGSMKNAADRPADEEVGAEPANETEKTEDDAPRMTRGGEAFASPGFPLTFADPSRLLRCAELASILRGGASALAKWGSEEGSDAFTEFREATFAELRERGKERDEKKEVGILADIGEQMTEEQRRQLQLEEEEAERLLLQGKEAVQSRKWEGASYKATVSFRFCSS